MRISSLKLCKQANTEGITFNEQFENELRELTDIVILTGGNGSGKSRFLKLLQKNVGEYINGSNSNEISFKVAEEDKDEQDFTIELAKSFNIINYSHFDARLQTADKFSPYVIHQSKKKLQKCNYEETALNSLLYLKDLSEGYSEESNETNNYKGLIEFIEFAKDLELDFSWDERERSLKVSDRSLGDANLSPGQLYALRIAVACKVHEVGENYIFIFDEPETHLHPSLLIKIINQLLEHFKNAQFWIATHSLPLISYLTVTRPDTSVFYMEKGCLSGRLRSNSEPILNNLVGLEEEQFAIKQLFVSSEEMACNKFCAECFLAPEVVDESKRDDPSSYMVEKDLTAEHKTKILKILDFGAGEARLLKCMYEDEFTNGYEYNAYNVEEKYAKACEKIIDSLHIEGESYLGKDSLIKLYGTIDRVYMVNVLHEISPEDWKQEFDWIDKLLKDDGKLVIVERETLTVGESPYMNGYLMLTGRDNHSKAAEILFGAENVQLERHETKKHIIGYTITKEGLKQSQKANLEEVFTALETDALSQIYELKRKSKETDKHIDKYKMGLQLAFWLNQISCAIMCRNDIKEKTKKRILKIGLQ